MIFSFFRSFRSFRSFGSFVFRSFRKLNDRTLIGDVDQKNFRILDRLHCTVTPNPNDRGVWVNVMACFMPGRSIYRQEPNPCAENIQIQIQNLQT